MQANTTTQINPEYMKSTTFINQFGESYTATQIARSLIRVDFSKSYKAQNYVAQSDVVGAAMGCGAGHEMATTAFYAIIRKAAQGIARRAKAKAAATVKVTAQDVAVVASAAELLARISQPITEFQPAQRVQAHPVTDCWMQGDRYGNVTRVGRQYVTVKMDKSGRLLRFSPANLLAV